MKRSKVALGAATTEMFDAIPTKMVNAIENPISLWELKQVSLS